MSSFPVPALWNKNFLDCGFMGICVGDYLDYGNWGGTTNISCGQDLSLSRGSSASVENATDHQHGSIHWILLNLHTMWITTPSSCFLNFIMMDCSLICDMKGIFNYLNQVFMMFITITGKETFSKFKDSSFM